MDTKTDTPTDTAPTPPVATPAPAPLAFDVAALAVSLAHEDEGITIPVLDERGHAYDPPESITIAGPRSRLAAAARTSAGWKLVKDGHETITDDVAALYDADYQLERAAFVVRAWTFKDGEGKPVPVTVQNARTILRVRPDIRQKVQEKLATFDQGPFPSAA